MSTVVGGAAATGKLKGVAKALLAADDGDGAVAASDATGRAKPPAGAGWNAAAVIREPPVGGGAPA